MATNNFGWCESQYHSGVAVFRHNEAYVSHTHRQLQIIRMQIEGEKYYNKSILVSESVLRSEKTQYYFIIRYQCDQSNKLNHSASSCCTVYVYIMIVMKTFFSKKMPSILIFVKLVKKYLLSNKKKIMQAGVEPML